MGSKSVTGSGLGSVKHYAWERNWVNGLFDGKITPNEFRSLEGVRSNIQNQIDAITPDTTTTTVVVSKNSRFSSIKDAIDSITDASNINRYIVEVRSGTYVEDTINLKSWVSIQGSAEQSVAVYLKENPSHEYLFFQDNQRGIGIYDLVFFNCPTVIKYKGNAFKIDRCRCREGVDLFIDATDITGTPNLNYVMISNCTTSATGALGAWFDISSSNEHPNQILINLVNCQTISPLKTVGKIGIVSGGSRGINSIVHLMDCCLYGDGTDTAFEVADGATLCILSSVIRGFNIGLKVPNEGDGPTLYLDGILHKDNTEDILIEHPNSDGVINVISCKEKITINDSAKISVSIQDIDGHGSLISGNIFNGETFSTMTEVTPNFQHGQAAGLLTGGTITKDSGLTINASAGEGYIYNGDPEINNAKYITWTEQQLLLENNADNYIYIDLDGTVKKSLSIPDFYATIVLGRVLTDNNDILVLQNISRKITAYGSRFDKIWRYYVGPIYRSGSIATINSGDNRKIDVTPGSYCYSSQEYAPSGGSPIVFSTWYRDNINWYVIAKNQDSVPNDKYDDESGILHTITDNYYVKHILLIYGGEDLEPEQYFLVYGQQEFDTLENAINGPLPSVPYELTRNIVPIASIIIQKGQMISEIRDERPGLTSSLGTITATSIHGNLSNLLADDHPQYLLINGTRPMSNNLDMGSKNIINVSTVDGVDVSSHNSRHLPNGDDELTTAAPNSNLSYNSLNSKGVQPSFARSDHTHKIVNSYGSFYDTTTQTASANSATAMKLNSVYTSNGVSIVDLTKITVQNTGIYDLQFSAQYDRMSGSGTGNISIWIRKNGVDVPDSCTDITMSGNADKSAIVAAWNFFIQLNAGQYAELMWSTPDTALQMKYVGTRINPIRPGIPSLILTMEQVA